MERQSDFNYYQVVMEEKAHHRQGRLEISSEDKNTQKSERKIGFQKSSRIQRYWGCREMETATAWKQEVLEINRIGFYPWR